MKTKEVTVLIGAGAMGLAIVRRVSSEKHILLSDLSQENAQLAAQTLEGAGFEVSTQIVDVTSRESVKKLTKKASEIGEVTKLVLATGISPSHASSTLILKVDLYGAAVVLEEFGSIIAPGGSGLIISSQSGHRLEPLSLEQEKSLASTPSDKLLDLPILNSSEISDPLFAYQLSKKGCSLRVKSEAVRWGKRGARVNAISPGIIITPLAKAELSGPNGNEYRKMIKQCPSGRAGTADEVAALAAHLMGPDGGFITGSDFLMDGGVTSAFWYGNLS